MVTVAITMSVGFLFHVHPPHEAAQWYETLGSWGLGWVYLIAWIAVPVITWMLANKALAAAREEVAGK